MDFAVGLENDDDFEEGQQELATLIGATEAAKLSWMSRLVRRPDGFRLRVMEPETDLRSQLIVSTYGSSWFENPWCAEAAFLRIRVREWPLAEGVELLRGEDNPEREISRRRELTRQYEERLQREKAAAIARAADSAAALERDRALDLEFRRAAWDELEPVAKFGFLAALALEDGEDLPTTLRELARGAAKGFRFPAGRVWWGP